MMAPLSAHSLPWLLAIGLPLLLAIAICQHRLCPRALRLAPWAALPALYLAVLGPMGSEVFLPWLLLGTQLGMDAIAQVFLCFTALLWTGAGVYARAYLAADAALHRFFLFFLLTMSGNLGLILAQDVISFYLFFALMSFASYGLVVHEGSREAYRAGRVYMSLVVMGEVLLVSALLLIVPATDNATFPQVTAALAVAPLRDFIIGLIVAGFGIKVGMLPLHVWLPLAHPVAPTPASAVLSGTMIKAGLLGWIRFLPLGEAALPGWGSLFMTAGLLAAFYGVLVGLCQTNSKTVLAYSSISQMGLMTIAIGIGLGVPAAWPAALSAALLYAIHHALAKGALFLGVGVVQQVSTRGQFLLVLAGLFLPALALAGAPLTSGAVAKLIIKDAVALALPPWPGWLGGLLSWAAVGTTLLMGHFVFLLHSSPPRHEPHLGPGLWMPWVALLTGGLVIPWLFVPGVQVKVVGKTLSFAALWPVLLGALLAWMVWRSGEKVARLTDLHVPAGDLLVVADWLVGCVQRSWHPQSALTRTRELVAYPSQKLSFWGGAENDMMRLESRLGRWANAGLLFLLLAAIFLAALILGCRNGGM